MSVKRLRVVGIGVLALAFVAGGCSQQARAERDGRDLAEATCDLRKATTADEVASAKEKIRKQLDDIVNRYGAATVEDRKDIDENLSDLAEHAAQGNELLLQQDLAVISRSADNIRHDASGVQAAAWGGFADGVNECLAD